MGRERLTCESLIVSSTGLTMNHRTAARPDLMSKSEDAPRSPLLCCWTIQQAAALFEFASEFRNEAVSGGRLQPKGSADEDKSFN